MCGLELELKRAKKIRVRVGLGFRLLGSGRARAWPYIALSLPGLGKFGRGFEICNQA